MFNPGKNVSFGETNLNMLHPMSTEAFHFSTFYPNQTDGEEVGI